MYNIFLKSSIPRFLLVLAKMISKNDSSKTALFVDKNPEWFFSLKLKLPKQVFSNLYYKGQKVKTQIHYKGQQIMYCLLYKNNY